MKRSFRILVCLGIGLLPLSCTESSSKPLPVYTPETFREDVSALISEQRYEDAVRYLASADPVRQARYDEEGYLAVAEDLIYLPGLEPAVEFDRQRDWEFPGTSDVLQDEDWQNAATDFAEQYNSERQTGTE